jgi:hypothetical protein
MQTKKWFVAALAASALMVSAVSNSTAAPSTNQAFQLDVKLKVSYEDPYSDKVAKTTITTSTIINLAMGINIDVPVPSNIVLAMVLDCDESEGYIAVVDTSSNNTLLAVVAPVKVAGSVDDKGKGVASILAVDFNSGNGTNGLFGGWLAIGGKVELNDETATCPIKEFKSQSLSGFIQGLDAVSAGGPFEVTVTGGSLKTVKDIGYVALIM